MPFAHVATKTLSVTLDAYEKLRRARRHPTESFTQVILRATWPEETITGAELLRLIDHTPPLFTDDGLEAIEQAKEQQQVPDDKWTNR